MKTLLKPVVWAGATIHMALFVAVIPLKVALYFGVMTRFKLRARTSLLASFGLANYSEFGLIAAAPLSAAANELYDRHRAFLKRVQTAKRLPEAAPVSVGGAEVVIVGMSGLGTAAYDTIVADFGVEVCGIDNDRDTVARHVAAGRNVVAGDPTDLDFWDRVSRQGTVKIGMLALPNHQSTLAAAMEMRKFEGEAGDSILTATARYKDEIAELEEHGVDAAFDLSTEAGQGYAHLVRKLLEREPRNGG